MVRTARRLGLGLAATIFVAACSGGGSDTVGTTTVGAAPNAPGATAPGATTPVSGAGQVPPSEPAESTPAAMTAEDASALLAAFDPALPVADELVTRRSDPELIAAARTALDAGATGWEQWAATYVWTNEGDNTAPLLPLLAADDPAVRVMAAAGLVGRGDLAGFEPLIAVLDDTAVLNGSEPPVPAWSLAATILVSLTGVSDNGPPFDADATQRSDAKQRWTQWFADHRASMQFDDTEGRWIA